MVADGRQVGRNIRQDAAQERCGSDQIREWLAEDLSERRKSKPPMLLKLAFIR
jgi:hypothetical protein